MVYQNIFHSICHKWFPGKPLPYLRIAVAFQNFSNLIFNQGWCVTGIGIYWYIGIGILVYWVFCTCCVKYSHQKTFKSGMIAYGLPLITGQPLSLKSSEYRCQTPDSRCGVESLVYRSFWAVSTIIESNFQRSNHKELITLHTFPLKIVKICR